MKFAVPLLLLLNIGCATRVPLETPRVNRGTPEVMRFVVHPRVIHAGQTAMLHWDARNTSEVMLEQAGDPHAARRADFQQVGKFPPSGTLTVSPKVTTIYVISCGDEVIGCSSASVRVVVR